MSSFQDKRKTMLGLNNAKPPVSRPRWTNEEDNLLLAEIKKKKSLEEIAANHHPRQVPAIKARLQKLAADFHEDNKSVSEIHTLTGLSQNEITRIIEKHKVAIEMISAAQTPVAKQTPVAQQTPVTIQTSIAPPTLTKVVKKVKKTNTIVEEKEQEQEPTMKQMFAILLSIQEKVKTLVPDEPEPTMHDLMRVVQDIQKRMDMLANK